jgi:hypothetical protein
MNSTTNEIPVMEIQKVKIKNSQLTVEYKEEFRESNFSNGVTKTCEQIVHDDLRYALALLKVHVVAICEMPEAELVNIEEPADDDINSTLDKIIVTGYSKGGSGESAGVCIIAQKILKTGQILNLTVPFTKFEDENIDGYSYGGELKKVINRCDYEVDAYLFGEKWGIKQLSLDFGEPSGDDTQPKPQKKGRKKKPQPADDFGAEPEHSISEVNFEEIAS